MRTSRWFEALYQCEQQGSPYALITVLAAAGSTPRNQGCKMVVTPDSQYDTIGGGHLEFASVEKARALLVAGKDTQVVESYPLASKLGQCCGGAMKVMIEVKANHCQHLALFGSGHVAQALVPILAQLPLQITWYDSREGMAPTQPLPNNVNFVYDHEPQGELHRLPENSWVVIMTHDHQLDYEIALAALKIGQFPYVGMIGSETKAKRFFTRLQARQLSQQQLAPFTCPIGNLAIPGKRPIEVAVSVSAQIITLLNTQAKIKAANIQTLEVPPSP
jgi:xanthine dehydrogenase accessory factor